ncbi:hypothetical protein AB0P19_03635 [Microbacterium oleivorans]|uniref:hypothetical protein n=1 Tax=Microbacterium oleivorans TaxID=273677 RepID=UPI0033D7E79D
MSSEPTWREHLDAAGAVTEGTAWLRVEGRRWLLLATTAGGCAHAEATAESYFDVELDAIVCGACAISVTGNLAGSWCARCGDADCKPRRHLAELDPGLHALVPLCPECAALESLAP